MTMLAVLLAAFGTGDLRTGDLHITKDNFQVPWWFWLFFGLDAVHGLVDLWTDIHNFLATGHFLIGGWLQIW